MKNRQGSYLLLICSILLAAPELSQADLCAKNSGEHFYIRVTEVTRNSVRLDRCDTINRDACHPIGKGALLDKKELYSLKSSFYFDTAKTAGGKAFMGLLSGFLIGVTGGLALAIPAGETAVGLSVLALSWGTVPAGIEAGTVAARKTNESKETENMFELANLGRTFEGAALPKRCVNIRSVSYSADILEKYMALKEQNRTIASKAPVSVSVSSQMKRHIGAQDETIAQARSAQARAGK